MFIASAEHFNVFGVYISDFDWCVAHLIRRYNAKLSITIVAKTIQPIALYIPANIELLFTLAKI